MSRTGIFVLAAFLPGFVLSACSAVPKEVVELSYRMGEDIASIETSYKKLIHSHFDSLRRERLRYLDEEWTPAYIRAWIADGRLVDVAKGEVAWSDEKSAFVKPTVEGREAQLLSTVLSWSQAAVADIEEKKTELLAPLDEQETQLTAWVDEAFNRLYRSNAAITAHLNSIRKVQEVQDETLAALNLRGLRDKINGALAVASDRAQKGLEAVKKADAALQRKAEEIKRR